MTRRLSFMHDPATTVISTLSLHDALPICRVELLLDLGDAPVPQLGGLGEVTVAFGPLGLAAKRVQLLLEFADDVDGEIGRATSELQSPVHLVCRLLLEKKTPQVQCCVPLH